MGGKISSENISAAFSHSFFDTDVELLHSDVTTLTLFLNFFTYNFIDSGWFCFVLHLQKIQFSTH
ncbi:MAG TPA: hypothetical protein DHM37_06935 [Candidatus Cloacimonas sp.]|jgi:hypothetical protein|nr:hypothetical protein [Candidatus Cloacimonas sp.]